MILPSLPLLIVSGLTAYVVSSWLLIFLRVIGVTRFVPRLYWSCAFFGGVTGAALFGGRMLRAFAMTALFPLIYSVIFEWTGNADYRFGAILGFGHALLVGIVLPIVASRAGCHKAPPPGLFGWRLGLITPLLILLVYAFYGATLGYVYVVVSP